MNFHEFVQRGSAAQRAIDAIVDAEVAKISPESIVYVGVRTDEGTRVFSVYAAGRARGELNPRLDVRDHSSTGFEWGYEGSGPAQLALALCIDVLDGDVARAQRIYQDFKACVVARLPNAGWQLSRAWVSEFIQSIDSVSEHPHQSERS
jgi:hypothetical protein